MNCRCNVLRFTLYTKNPFSLISYNAFFKYFSFLKTIKNVLLRAGNVVFRALVISEKIYADNLHLNLALRIDST